MLAGFAASDEDDVALTGVDILVLQDEEFVHAILFKCSDFHNVSNRPNQASIEDKVLLAVYLPHSLSAATSARRA